VIEPEGQKTYEILKTSGTQLAAGTVVSATAGGGGGYGKPADRLVDKVRQDVINGYVSVESAHRDYGVVIDPVTFALDEEATQKLRKI
jgi:N-methylhydantoinase B